MEFKVGIFGMGYVGLPLAIAFGEVLNTVGYDTNVDKIKLLKKNQDINKEINSKQFRKSKHLVFSNNYKELFDCNIFIIAVPTPITKNYKPDLKFLKSACDKISKILKKDDIVILESTVFPGLTQNYCAKILEKKSKLKYNVDFYCGYSPERINPGDKKHTIKNIKKIVSGSTAKITNKINKLYKRIITAGTIKVKSIEIAEAAKVIENAQRDINIAFINELFIIFQKMNINTYDVLKAASTKWNFNYFEPGLVGGHCIGVDPYYLTYKSESIGYKPKVILSGRSLNNNMPKYYANSIHKDLKTKFNKTKLNILLCGITFKENCSDIRNSKVFDLYKNLIKKGHNIDVFDPLAISTEVKKIYKINIQNKLINKKYHGIIIAVKHDKFLKIGYSKFSSKIIKNGKLFDLKNIFRK